jgi:hypothetical protein
MSKYARTARGEQVDLDLMKIKNDMSKHGVITTPEYAATSSNNIAVKEMQKQAKLQALLQQEQELLKIAAGSNTGSEVGQ